MKPHTQANTFILRYKLLILDEIGFNRELGVNGETEKASFEDEEQQLAGQVTVK